MNLHVRNPRARELAFQLAAKRKISMTKAVVEALESELKREGGCIPLADRLAAIASDLKARAGQGGRPVTKDEIDDMWGHP
jgi:antitoxin VapB